CRSATAAPRICSLSGKVILFIALFLAGVDRRLTHSLMLRGEETSPELDLIFAPEARRILAGAFITGTWQARDSRPEGTPDSYHPSGAPAGARNPVAGGSCGSTAG